MWNEEAKNENLYDGTDELHVCSDQCKDCIRKGKPTIEKCFECGEETMTSYLDGLCMVYHCSSCGLEVVGASFFPPCMLDNDKYTITVKLATKKTYVKLARLFSTNVVALKDALDTGKAVSKTVRLFEAEKIIRELKKLDIKFEVTPDLLNNYSELITCELKGDVQYGY